MEKNPRWFPWLYEEITPEVRVEESSAIFLQHFLGREMVIHDFPPEFSIKEIFRGWPKYCGNIDPRYSLWHIRHSYFGDLSNMPHFDKESVYLLILLQQKVELVFYQNSLFGIAAARNIQHLAPIWAHILALVAEEQGWRIG